MFAQMDLRTYLKTLSPPQQTEFAKRCGTTIGYLRKWLCVGTHIGPSTAIAIERESGGLVRCEELAPNVDWAYIRGQRPATEAIV